MKILFAGIVAASLLACGPEDTGQLSGASEPARGGKLPTCEIEIMQATSYNPPDPKYGAAHIVYREVCR